MPPLETLGQMIIVGEMFGGLDMALGKIAQQLAKRCASAVRCAVSILRPW
jgi:type II secretory pathway component PulF